MAQHASDQYPKYSVAEKWADGAVHLAGLGAALVAIATFLSIHSDILNGGQIASLTIYWIGLVAMLAVSFCYHMTPWEEYRAGLRRIDHATIFLKIAGTYTPLVMTIGTALGYVVLGIVWGLALFGASLRLFRWRSPGRLNAALYLGLGWLSCALVWNIFQAAPAAGWCVVAGGLLYTGGTVFFHWEGLKFSNAIWHGFVVVASAFFFAAIWISSVAI